MTGKRWVLAATAAALVAGVGCVNCRHKGYQEALCPPDACELPPPVRNQVFLFMMNGNDPLQCADLMMLRDRLCQAGYPMVYYAQRADKDWYYREMRRVAREHPDARLLLLGYGGAARQVVALAYDAARDELPIDSVIFLDPVGVNGDLAATLPYHTVAVRSHNWHGSRGLETSEVVVFDRRGHFSLPNNPETEEVLMRLLSEAAGRVSLPPADVPMLPLRDRPDPTPRGIDPATLAYTLDAWDFLKPGPPFPTLPPEFAEVPPPGRCIGWKK
jgi:hypothetical protein